MSEHYRKLIDENIKRLKLRNDYRYPGICHEKFRKWISDSLVLIIRVTYDVTENFKFIPQHEETYTVEYLDDKELKNVIKEYDIQNLQFENHDTIINHYYSLLEALAEKLFKK